MKHILIVDDNKTNLASARTALADNYKTTAVISGAQAIKFLERNSADLILLDINMPEMDGFETMEHIRHMADHENTPIIFLTADNEPETETRCLEAGALDFIAKPFVTPVMLSRISRILELEDLRKSLADRLDQKIREVSDMKNRSFRDALTGLWNRAYTEETVDNMLKEGTKGALFMIDMDNFKAINDNYGHLEGDKTLKYFAEIMTKYAAEGDILCRIGGDEFVTFIKDETSKSALGKHAADIIADICRQLDEWKFDTNSSVSIGIAQCPEDGTDFKTLYNAADKALYFVKLNGKNSFHFYSEQSAAEKQRKSEGFSFESYDEMLKRENNYRGAYSIDFDNFHHIYNYVKRNVDRYETEIQSVLFTLSGDANSDENEYSIAADCLEQTLCSSMRKADVISKYSSKQIIAIISRSNEETAETVISRVIDRFKTTYTGNIDISFSIMPIAPCR